MGGKGGFDIYKFARSHPMNEKEAGNLFIVTACKLLRVI
jgi:hypothetical protein